MTAPRPRALLFIAGNLAVLALLWWAVAAPGADYLASLSDRIQTQAGLLARYRAEADKGPALEAQTRLSAADASGGDFLAAAGDGAASANLQARLKALAETSGAALRSVRALPAKQIGNVTYMGARLEISGTLKAVQASLHQVESTAPFLSITSCIMRLAGSGRRPAGDDEPWVEAQFDVYGAVRAKNANE